MKVVFLDVDGELTYNNYENEETANIDIEKVKLLKKICDGANAKVVISSSWRGSKNYIPKIYHILVNILISNGIEVLGNTPHLKTEFEGFVPDKKTVTSLNDLEKMKIKHGTGRAAEISKWLSEHAVDGFVILDDEDWQWADYGYESHWIRPTWYGDGGLKKEHVVQAMEILNGKLEEIKI